MTCHFFLMMWYFFIKKLKKFIYKLKKKKKNRSNSSKTHDSNIEPFHRPLSFKAKTKSSISIMEKEKKKKKKKKRMTTVFATTEQYNCFRWPEIEEFPTWRGGWISLQLSAKPRHGAEVWWWWWWRQWLDSMDRNMVLVLLCFSETFWRLLECQKAYVCVREKECVTSKAICIHGKYGSSWCLWEVEKSGSQG